MFAVVLFAGVLLSGVAHRTILSTAVLFLLAGVLLGDGVTGVLELGPDDGLVIGLAELALFSVLYTDGMRVGFNDLRGAWRLPGRALVLGMPSPPGAWPPSSASASSWASSCRPWRCSCSRAGTSRRRRCTPLSAGCRSD